MRHILSIRAKHFRSLADVDVRFGPFTVLIGPNGSGKSNLLGVLRFLGDIARDDLDRTVRRWGGMESIRRASPDSRGEHVVLEVTGTVSEHAAPSAPDEYRLEFWETKRGNIAREEQLAFKRFSGPGRRITVSGDQYTLSTRSESLQPPERTGAFRSSSTTALATLPKLAPEEGGRGIAEVAGFLEGIFVFEPDVRAIRRPALRDLEQSSALRPDAANLGLFLDRLRREEPDRLERIEADLAGCLPGARGLEFAELGGNLEAVEVRLREQGLERAIPLAHASWGTVRLLALLAVLHRPGRHRLIAIEELDAGLHPYALDLLVDRLREAAEHTQLLIASHSPTLVNRLRPEEMLVCDRHPETGESVIPARTAEEVRQALERAPDFAAGELWFAGVLGGVPE